MGLVNIMKPSLWDLKLGTIALKDDFFQIMKPSLWDLKLYWFVSAGANDTDHEAIPMGFETRSYRLHRRTLLIMKPSLWDLKLGGRVFVGHVKLIMKPSLWDLKLSPANRLRLIPIDHEAIPMGFETGGGPQKEQTRRIMKPSLWDLKPVDSMQMLDSRRS